MIPLRMPALEWEQLGGYLLRVARQLACPLPTLTLAAAIPVRNGNRLAGLSALPDEDALCAVSDFLGLPAADVRQMTLHRFRTRLFGLTNATSCAGTNPEAPLTVTGGLYCPKCVAVGYWDLRWKTGLVAVCTKHRRYVWCRCPTCGGGVAPETIRTPLFIGDDTLRHATSKPGSCEAFLAEDHSVVDVRHLHTQELVNRLIERAQTDASAAARCRDLLRWAEYLHRGTREHGFMSGGFLATDGTELADLLTVSLELVNSPESAHKHPRLVDAVHLQRAVGRVPSQPPLYAPLDHDADDVVAHVIGRASTIRPPRVFVPMPGLRKNATALPKVVPVSLFAPALADPLQFVGYDRARAVAAMSVCAPPGQPLFRAIARRMGSPEQLGHSIGQVLSYLEHAGTAEGYWAAVNDTRRDLLDIGIDFTARARLVEHDNATLEAARRTWTGLRGLGDDALRQWLLDRWACQYHATAGRSPGGGGGRLADHRATVDALIGDPATIGRVWRDWDPAVSSEARGAAG